MFLQFIQQFRVSARSTSPNMTTVFHAWAYGRFIEIPDQGSNFLGESFSNRDNQTQHLRRLFFHRNRPIHFHINSKSVARSVKRKMNFSSIDIENSLPALIHSILQIKVQKPILVVSTDEKPDHTQSREQYHQHRYQCYRKHHHESN